MCCSLYPQGLWDRGFASPPVARQQGGAYAHIVVDSRGGVCLQHLQGCNTPPQACAGATQQLAV